MKQLTKSDLIRGLLNKEYNVKEIIDKFQEENKIQESSLKFLFSLPESGEVIFSRVVLLNQTYSTGLSANILSKEKYDRCDKPKYQIDVQHVSHYIYENNEELNNLFAEKNFAGAVYLIMGAVRPREKEDKNVFYNIYSFATKYCYWKDGGVNTVPIYDSYLHGMVEAYFKVKGKECTGKIRIEKDDKTGEAYSTYIKCIEAIMEEGVFSGKKSKEVDCVLWQLAKDNDKNHVEPWEYIDWQLKENKNNS